MGFGMRRRWEFEARRSLQSIVESRKFTDSILWLWVAVKRAWRWVGGGGFRWGGLA
jgi:hypothetical protein